MTTLSCGPNNLLATYLAAFALQEFTGFIMTSTELHTRKHPALLMLSIVPFLFIFAGNSFAAIDQSKNQIISKHGVVAYTWNSNPTAKSAVLSTSSYTFNNGKAVTRIRDSKGIYQVIFDGLNCNRGQFTVNAYGGTNFKMCRIGSWSGKSNCEVSVYCFNAQGSPLDSEFNLLFID